MEDQLRASDVRRCWVLVRECSELGEDAGAWRTHAVDGLRGLMRAQVGIGSETPDLGTMGGGAYASEPGPIRRGWADADCERAWLDYATTTPVRRTPEFTPMSRAAGRPMTRLRRELWPDEQTWRRSRTFNEHHRPAGIDDYIMSICPTPLFGRISTLWMHRSIGERPFGARERRMLHLVHAELARQIGGRLASTTQPAPAMLTPRQRQVLELLLEGLTEKEAAARLGISCPTLREHTALVYKRFGVHGRSELMAEFVRRSRPSGSTLRPPVPSAEARA